METTIETTIKPGASCGATEIRISSGPYATGGYGIAKLDLTVEQARELAAVLTAAIAAHAVARSMVPARAAVAGVEADAVADAMLPPNAEVVS